MRQIESYDNPEKWSNSQTCIKFSSKLSKIPSAVIEITSVASKKLDYLKHNLLTKSEFLNCIQNSFASDPRTFHHRQSKQNELFVTKIDGIKITAYLTEIDKIFHVVVADFENV